MIIIPPPTEKLYETIQRLLLDDAKSDLKAQTIIEIEYNNLQKQIKNIDITNLPYYTENTDPTLNGYYIKTKHIYYIILQKDTIKDTLFAADMDPKTNIIYCSILDTPSIIQNKPHYTDLLPIIDKTNKLTLTHEIQHILDKYRFINKDLLNKIPNSFKSKPHYYNYSPKMNGHISEIIAAIKEDVLDTLNQPFVLNNLPLYKKQYTSIIIDSLLKIRNYYQANNFLDQKAEFITQLTEKHFRRLLQRTKAIIELLFDNKSSNLLN